MGEIWIDYIPFAKAQFPDGRFGFTVRAPIAGDKTIVVGEGAWGASVNAQTKGDAKDAAMAFVNYLSQPETMMTWVKAQNALPSTPDLLEHPYYKSAEGKWLRGALKVLPDSVYQGDVGFISKLNFDIAWPAMQEAMAKQISVEEAAERIDQEGAEQLAEYRALAG